MDKPVHFLDASLWFSRSEPIRREGMQFVAAFDGPVSELKIRRGRLTAKVGDTWHIIPFNERAEQ